MDYNIGGRMSRTDRSAIKEDATETAESYYSPPQPKTEPNKHLVGSLVVQLNSRKTQLRDIVAEVTSLKQRLNDLDSKTEKETILHQFQTEEAKRMGQQTTQLLMQKEVVARELFEVSKVQECLSADLEQEMSDLQARQACNSLLTKQGDELRAKLKAREQESEEVGKYIVELERLIEENDNGISAHKDARDAMVKKTITLQTFSKAFEKNIQGKQKELLHAQRDQRELQSLITSKQDEKRQKEKASDEKQWECRQYVHHNKDIRENNERLKTDLENLMKHLSSLKRNNQQLGGCLKEYSETGVAAAKKILKLANK